MQQLLEWIYLAVKLHLTFVIHNTLSLVATAVIFFAFVIVVDSEKIWYWNFFGTARNNLKLIFFLNLKKMQTCIISSSVISCSCFFCAELGKHLFLNSIQWKVFFASHHSLHSLNNSINIEQSRRIEQRAESHCQEYFALY